MPRGLQREMIRRNLRGAQRPAHVNRTRIHVDRRIGTEMSRPRAEQFPGSCCERKSAIFLTVATDSASPRPFLIEILKATPANASAQQCRSCKCTYAL
jgi:hypothetical protein